MGVEDRRLGLTDLAGGAGAQLADDAPDRGDRLAEPAPLDRRLVGGGVRNGDGAQPRRAGRADTQPGPAPIGACRVGGAGMASAGDSSKLRAASDRTWSSVSAAWLPDTRISTSSPDRTPSVAIFERLAASTHSDVGAAVADPRMGVAAAHLLHQSRSRSGMQPVRVGDDEAARQLGGVAVRLG